MTARKKRLILVQTILLIAAILLLYIFYYQGNKIEDKIIKKRIDKEVVENENLSNFFEDVEYKGIDANGNRYLLHSI